MIWTLSHLCTGEDNLKMFTPTLLLFNDVMLGWTSYLCYFKNDAHTLYSAFIILNAHFILILRSEEHSTDNLTKIQTKWWVSWLDYLINAKRFFGSSYVWNKWPELYSIFPLQHLWRQFNTGIKNTCNLFCEPCTTLATIWRIKLHV